MTNFHPPADLLLDYAAGVVSEGVALAVVTHGALCRDCQNQIDELERVAGDLLDRAHPADVSSDVLEKMMDLLDRDDSRPPEPRFSFDAETRAIVPAPLRRYLTGNLDGLPWKRFGRPYLETRLPLRAGSIKASLMRLKPRSIMPRHSHRGLEYTVVLAGGFRDDLGQYARGDFTLRSPSDEHQPVVDPDGECICLAVLDAPIRLSGLVGRVINPFLRI